MDVELPHSTATDRCCRRYMYDVVHWSPERCVILLPSYFREAYVLGPKAPRVSIATGTSL